MKTLQELTKLSEKHLTNYRKVQNDIDELKGKIELPKFQNEYVGKCYVYDNGTSREDRWNLYQKIIGISNVMFVRDSLYVTAELFRFEDHHGNESEDEHIFEVSLKATFPLDMVGREITQKQFDAAWDKMIEKIKKMKR